MQPIYMSIAIQQPLETTKHVIDTKVISAEAESTLIENLSLCTQQGT